MLRVALLQILPGQSQEENKSIGEQFCRQAKAKGADIALFPEMWNIGYEPYHSEIWDHDYNPLRPKFPELIKPWQEQAISENSSFVRHFKMLAKELEMAIALTYLQKWEGHPRNALTLFDRFGKTVMTYAKVHTCDFSLEAHCTPGYDFSVSSLNTRQGEVQIGSMICYDREFPESARILMLKGAEVIIVPNACDLEQNRLAQLRTRAYENMVGVAVANYPAPKTNGHSVAFDGMGFDEQGSRDMLLVEAGEQEGIYFADFDLEALRDYRKRETWGNAFRKVSAYRKLVDSRVDPPFVRENARR